MESKHTISSCSYTIPKVSTSSNDFKTPPPSLNTIPHIPISSSGLKMPLLGMGTASYPLPQHEDVKCAVIEAIKLGYRHFDTSPRYKSEQPLGEAIAHSLSIGLVDSRDEFFITSKLWSSDAHQGLVLPALKRSLEDMKLDYLDLYLIHFPLSLTPGLERFPIEEDLVAMDFKAVWSEMEECKRLGLAKAIGVSNFSCKKLQHILSIAKIPPCVNQVEMNPLLRQKNLIELCKANGIVLTAYSVLGASGTLWGDNKVMESHVLKEIAKSNSKTVAQVCLRWVYEQGVCLIVKSFNKERLKENLNVFDWSLSEEDNKKINEISQIRSVVGKTFVSPNGPFKTFAELWDEEI